MWWLTEHVKTDKGIRGVSAEFENFFSNFSFDINRIRDIYRQKRDWPETPCMYVQDIEKEEYENSWVYSSQIFGSRSFFFFYAKN